MLAAHVGSKIDAELGRTDHGAFGMPCCDAKVGKGVCSHDAVPSPPRLPRPLPLVKYRATRKQRPHRQRTHRSSSLRIAPTLYCVRIIWSIRKAPPLPSPKARCSARSACPQRSGTLDSGLSRHRTGQPRLSSKQSVTPPRTDRRSIHTHTQGTHSELQFHSHFSIIQLASGILPFPSSNTPSFHLFSPGHLRFSVPSFSTTGGELVQGRRSVVS